MISSEVKTLSNCKKELHITMQKEALDPIREKEAGRVQRPASFCV